MRRVALLVLLPVLLTGTPAALAAGPTCQGLAVTKIGTSGADRIVGTSGRDVVLAGGGNDVIVTNGGDDVICAGDGNDVVRAADGHDRVDGGNGTDKIEGGRGNDVLLGAGGNDSLAGQAGNDRLDGGAGNDVLSGHDGSDVLLGASGADVLRGGAQNDRLEGAGGRDVLRGDLGNDVLRGGDDADDIQGNQGGDTINGGNGDDRLLGGDGNDSIVGGAGNDVLLGEQGDDALRGDAGADRVDGGAGADRIDDRGRSAGDVVAPDGRDTVLGAAQPVVPAPAATPSAGPTSVPAATPAASPASSSAVVSSPVAAAPTPAAAGATAPAPAAVAPVAPAPVHEPAAPAPVSQPAAAAAPAPAATGPSISGRVTGADGAPLVGMSVTVADYSQPVSYSVRTAADGSFRAADLPAGEYTVRVADGTRSHLPAYFGGADATVIIVRDKPIADVVVALALARSITGTVRDGEGRPVPGLDVSAAPTAGPGGYGTARTAADGTYLLRGLEPITWSVTVHDPQQRYLPALAVGVDARGGNVVAQDQVVQRAGTITGRVSAKSDSAALADVHVVVQDAVSGYWQGSATTSADGSYVVRGLPPGKHIVQVHGNALLVGGYAPGVRERADAAVLTVGHGSTSAADIAIERMATVSGTLVDEAGAPVAGVDVHASGNGSYGSTRTAADGTYAINGLVPGAYYLTFSDQMRRFESQRYGMSSVDHEAPRNVALTEAGFRADATLLSVRSISGIVTAAGAPAAGVDVSAGTDGVCCWSSAKTDAEGRYTILGVGRGDREIRFAQNDPRFFRKSYDGNGDSTLLVDTRKGDVTGVDEELRVARSLTITVTGDDGVPASGVDVRIYPVGSELVEGGARTSSAGLVKIGQLGDGPYQIQVYDYTRRYQATWYGGTSRETAAEVRPAQVAVLDVTAARTVTLTGVVRGTSGGPVAGARVRLLGASYSNTQTDAEGRYSFRQLDAGTYPVEVEDPSGNHLRTLVERTVPATGSSGDITLTTLRRLSGVALDDASGAAAVGAPVRARVSGAQGYDVHATTDAAGAYVLRVDPKLDYVVQFGDCCGGSYFIEHYDGAGGATSVNDALTLKASGQDMVLNDVHLSRRTTIAGFVRDAADNDPLEGYWVEAVPVVGAGSGSTTSRLSGFSITSLRAGQYYLIARDASWSKTYYYGGTDAASAARIDTSEADVTDIEFLIDRTS